MASGIVERCLPSAHHGAVSVLVAALALILVAGVRIPVAAQGTAVRWSYRTGTGLDRSIGSAASCHVMSNRASFGEN